MASGLWESASKQRWLHPTAIAIVHASDATRLAMSPIRAVEVYFAIGSDRPQRFDDALGYVLCIAAFLIFRDF